MHVHYNLTVHGDYCESLTARKVPKHGVLSGPYLPVFKLNTERYGISPYSVQIRENKDQEKLRIRTLFTQYLLRYL